MRLTAAAPLWGGVSYALCLGAVDWHNYGKVLGVWEFGWDWFLYIFLLYVQYHGHCGPLYYCYVMGPRASDVARGICLILWLIM